MNYSKLFQDIKEQKKEEYRIPFYFSYDRWTVLDYRMSGCITAITSLEGLIKLGTFNMLSTVIRSMIQYMDFSNDSYYYKDLPISHDIIKYLSGTKPLDLKFMITRLSDLESTKFSIGNNPVIQSKIKEHISNLGHTLTNIEMDNLIINPFLLENNYVKKDVLTKINPLNSIQNKSFYNENKYRYKLSLLSRVENQLEIQSGCTLINIINLFFIVLCKVNNIQIDMHELSIIDKTYNKFKYQQDKLKYPTYKLNFKQDLNKLIDYKAKDIELILLG